jgi:DNA-binding NtrC family response regulator
MPYSVLILDDDADFNSLLTDIFEQADYTVTSIEDPIEAVEVFRNTDYDLVVTDHRMPGMTGSEFMKVIKQLKPEVPVIMVSGYLENDTIRELIGAGVGGVFLKPLNIFSLLERTAELIEEAKKVEQSSESKEEEQEGGNQAQFAKLGFNFRSFPCKSSASVKFAERLHGLMNFKSTLSLIGERGSRFRAICEDLRMFYENDGEHFVYLSPGSFDAEQVLSMIENAKKAGAERVTCVLLEIESMSEGQRELATLLSKCEGVFKSVEIDLRTIFCVSGDLDTLFDEGLIDENLYILMGTAEVQIPPLRDCPSDVAVLAQQMVVDIVREQKLSGVPSFEKSARDLLQKQPWNENYDELSALVRKVMDAKPGDVLTHAVVSDALRTAVVASPHARFEAYLSSQQVDYVRAALILVNGERTKAANFFGTDVNLIDSILK